MSDINVNDLATLSPSALDGDYYGVVFTPNGDTNKVVFEDAVEQAVKNVDYGVRYYLETIATGDVLTSNATPVTINIPRDAGKTVFPIWVNFVIDGGTTPYATNTVAAVRYVGADIDMFTCDVLGRTNLTGAEVGAAVTTCGNAQTQVLANTDLEFYTKTGNPTAGDGSLIIAVVYLIY
jgi:hypothetical protein